MPKRRLGLLILIVVGARVVKVHVVLSLVDFRMRRGNLSVKMTIYVNMKTMEEELDHALWYGGLEHVLVYGLENPFKDLMC